MLLNKFACFKTKGENYYFFDKEKKIWQWIHPVLHFLIERYSRNEDAEDIDKWIENLPPSGIEIKGSGNFGANDVRYYYQKFLFLKKAGYFQKKEPISSFNQVSPDGIAKCLANAKQLTFEVTELCQLECRYCGYGSLYDNHEPRIAGSLNIETARQILRYFIELWNSSLNESDDKLIFISFYGGEPLLKFDFIQDAVRFITENTRNHKNRFAFSITTNGLLLNRYIKFLADHQFHILISIDGNRKHHSHRIYRNGKSSFDDVKSNIDNVMRDYPAYFRQFVQFNTVIHNHNSIHAVYDFFKSSYNKLPRITGINTVGVSKKQQELFRELFRKADLMENEKTACREIDDEMFLNLPSNIALTTFLHHSSQLFVRDYCDLLIDESKIQFRPTGTCTPFEKKIFVTTRGKIYPCERCGHRFPLGEADSENVKLDPVAISKIFNELMSKMVRLCSHCDNAEFCTQCVYHLEMDENNFPFCDGFSDSRLFSGSFSAFINFVESDPGKYFKLLNKTVVE